MRLPQLFILLFLCNYTTVFSQKIIKHTVKSGESIYSIAKKYDVTEKEVFDLNPKLKGNILSLKAVVQIPNKKYKEESKKEKNKKKEVIEETMVEKDHAGLHLISPKETLYSISKNYGVSIEAICELNPELKTNPLKAGSRIKLPFSDGVTSLKKEDIKPIVVTEKIDESKKIDPNSDVEVLHKVLPKETLYRISKQYGVSISDLYKNNPAIENGLPIDYMLVIKKGKHNISNEKEPVVIVKDSLVITDEVADDGEDALPLSAENMTKAEFLIGKASENLGTRYRSGGTTTAGFDCSGFMCYTFDNIDMKLPRSSREMAGFGKKIKRSKAQKGDLIFFATFGRGRISHVGMVTEVLDDEIKFIHSSTSSGVIVSSTKERYYAKTFVQVNRVLNN